jgi:hypothetical protein
MVTRSKNEDGNASCKSTASSARDTEKPPHKLTASEKEALAKFEAASETRASKLTAIGAQPCFGETEFNATV